MKNILLTGSNGFVGSYFIDNYKDKYNINTFSFLNDDFKDLNLSKINTIIHLSALVHQMGGASKEEYEKVNVRQTIDLAKKAKSSGVKHFIFMSTVKVYGEETNIAYDENSDCNPQDDYGKSKLKAEQELLKLEDDSFKVSIVRTPIVYGYGVKANIKSLINLVNKVTVLPFANIKNKRSMIYVGNLCNLIDEIIIQEKEGTFLASDDEPLSTTRLIELIANGLGKKVYFIKIPFFESLLKLVKPSFHKRLYESLEVDNSETKKVLGFKNKYSVEEGI
ncbi:NAD-dependent epimerase/dehydratase family protein, partial [bacterium]|nr:NAD-dependent epimerase/dehydratase family protein [bacterium]